MRAKNASGFRSPDENYWKFVTCISPGRAQVSPFCIFPGGRAICITYWKDLMSADYTDDTLILHTWPGEYKSDTFAYSLGEFKKVTRPGYVEWNLHTNNEMYKFERTWNKKTKVLDFIENY